MGIKGLTDEVASFPCIGTLRKGDVKTGNAPGKDLDHFRFDTDDTAAAEMFKAAYGDKPRVINVFLPFATAEENGQFWMEHWVAGGLVWRGDGENEILWQDAQGNYRTEVRPQPQGEGKPTGRVHVIIPELERLAYVLVVTTSWHDCRELSANMRAAEMTARQMGKDLRGIPFRLTRVQREISTPTKDGKRARRGKWLLHLEVGPEWVSKQLTAARDLALQFDAPKQMFNPALPAPEYEEDDDEQRVIDHVTGEIVEEEPEKKSRTPREKKESPPAEDRKEPEVTTNATSTRPYTPEVLIPKFRKHITDRGENVPIKKGKDKLANKEQRDLLVSKMSELFTPDDMETINKKVSALFAAVVDNPNPMLLGEKAAMVFESWMLGPTDDTGDRPIKPYVTEEAVAIVEKQLAHQGRLAGLE
jgi:hypothetical protein